jgi:hypothetical protein
MICKGIFATIHHHHVVPVHCGGKNGPQVPLCGQCHTTLHAQAVSIVSKTRTAKNYWVSEQHQEAAIPLLKVLVASLRRLEQTTVNPDSLDQVVPVQLRLTRYEYSQLCRLRDDMNESSLAETVRKCLLYVITTKLGDVNNEKANRQRPVSGCSGSERGKNSEGASQGKSPEEAIGSTGVSDRQWGVWGNRGELESRSGDAGGTEQQPQRENNQGEENPLSQFTVKDVQHSDLWRL